MHQDIRFLENAYLNLVLTAQNEKYGYVQIWQKKKKKKKVTLNMDRKQEFPGGPVVGTRHFHCGGLGSIPGQGTKIPHAMQCGQKNPPKNKKIGPKAKQGEEVPICSRHVFDQPILH